MTDIHNLIRFVIPKLVMSQFDSHSQEEEVVDLLSECNFACDRKSEKRRDGGKPEITCSPSPCVFDPLDEIAESGKMTGKSLDGFDF